MPALSTLNGLDVLANPSTAGAEAPDATPLALTTLLNGRDHRIPMNGGPHAYSSVRNAAELVRSTGGFQARLLQATWLTVRISLVRGAEAIRVQRRIAALAGDLLQMGMDATPDGAPPSSIPGLRVRDHGRGRTDAELYIENADVPGQLCLEAAARHIALPLARLAECESAPTLQVIRSEVEQVRISCRVDIDELAEACAARGDTPEAAAVIVRSGIDELMRRFGSDSHQPLLAAQHNDQLLDAATATALALGLDPRRFERGARTHATRWGSCEPLAKWRRRDRQLLGQLQIPLDGGPLDAGGVAPTIGEQTPNGLAPSDLFLQVASVALAASLGFLERELFDQRATRRRTNLLPPPLQEHGRGRPLRHPAAEKASSESGVRPAIQATRGAFLSRTG
jgi:hypothetical protein